ncbi:MAG: hypothetical protein HOE73_07995 [Bacteroidetes Order II. Incertae sedis bacterium]|nr:hypothetical protein [Bacteroidetes Order II. bacterium]
MKTSFTLFSERNLLIALAFFFVLPIQAQNTNDVQESSILEVVSKVFEGINTHDGDLIRSVMAPSAILFSSSMLNEIPRANMSTAEQFAEGVSDPDQGFIERMFETEVRIREGIATVWDQYDFHINKRFSHCGVDTFSLIRSAEGWKIVSLIYTVENEGCPERPALED